MKIIEKDINEITLQKKGCADLNICFDYNHNYWFYSKMGDVNYHISAYNLNERSEYNSFYYLMESLIGKYFLFIDDGREFWDSESKTITIQSDPIDYLGKTYKGATLKLQFLDGFIDVKLQGEEVIEGKTILKIEPNKRSSFCLDPIGECFCSLKKQAVKEIPKVNERKKV